MKTSLTQPYYRPFSLTCKLLIFLISWYWTWNMGLVSDVANLGIPDWVKLLHMTWWQQCDTSDVTGGHWFSWIVLIYELHIFINKLYYNHMPLKMDYKLWFIYVLRPGWFFMNILRSNMLLKPKN